ncbi:uncharacterized protein SPSK_06271 [Sporothrix schenckii 1099-18]|uniref:Uncharacterized protein n=1 Tax=Sporothrix schenckii 1099-18 TaxID=1397361 RepID=A0A0F2MNE5_SPOSC|nr:uncharacterized protein SPSK_06271 [Sporothrix schenckii 1099-18]KJR89701.1 hypothetical protein SPSK_06271 [Sporothrix schenckii 1099-18]
MRAERQRALVPTTWTALVLALACLFFDSTATADVVILPGGAPRRYNGPPGATSLDDFYRRSAANEFDHASSDEQVLMGVFDDSTFQTANQVLPSSESFVRGALQAWAEHLHLVLRPDEVWFTILTQLFFYVGSHRNETAEIYEPRAAGADPMTLSDFEWFRVIQDFKYEAESHCHAPWLMLWAMPNFTTSTVVDEMTSTVILLGQNEAHAAAAGQPEEGRRPACGLPSVTLEGAQDDWAEMLRKLDRLPAFGSQAAAYKDQLTPILRQFIRSFDAPDSTATRLFWNQIVTAAGDNPACLGTPEHDTVSGWLTGFFYWTSTGQRLVPLNSTIRSGASTKTSAVTRLDNVTYGALALVDLPISYARAPFILRDFNNTAKFEAYVLAGTLGKQVSPGAPDGYADALRRANQTALLTSVNSTIHSALMPLSAWMLYGPANFTAPEVQWEAEPELADLAASLRVVSNDTQCQGKTNHARGFGSYGR